MDSQGGLNSTQAALLGLLRMHGPMTGGEMTGGELVRAAKLMIGDYWTITRSQVYRELGVLADQGLLAAGLPGPREARPFRLTEAGEAAFLAWLDQEPGEDTVRLPILLAVLFGGALPHNRLAEILDGYESRHRENLDRYRSLEAELASAKVDLYSRATLSFGIFYEEAVLRWLESLPPALRRPQDPKAPMARRPRVGVAPRTRRG
ncbi:MAG: PadR family transcriptional regulator [Acidimicrobiales bacterium]